MQISPDWLTKAETQSVFRLLTGAGYQAYAVGGCVRDAVLGLTASDIDLATDARPGVVIELVESAGYRAIPTGVEHGTVTVIVGGVTFEVTTFRRDVETDGRRAVVAFSDTLNEDAQRRDFTMNALYMAADGHITDPVGGLRDLKARRVRFIGHAVDRIREDYLRTLRFFRFHAWYAAADAGFDAEDLAAIAETLEGLAHLSAERVTTEVLKLLAAPDPAPAIATMAQVNVLMTLLPGADVTALAPLVHLEAGRRPDALRRLAVLGPVDMGRLRLSKAEARHYETLRKAALDGDPSAVLAYRHGRHMAEDSVLVRCALLGQELPETLMAELDRGSAMQFPVKATDLMPAVQGAALGVALKRLEAAWIASDFALTKTDLLSQI